MINIKIKKYSGGEHEIYSSSPGEWEKFIPDLREPLQMLTDDSLLKEDTYFLTLTTSELGYYVGILKPLRGSQRPDDHLAGWLFIARNLQISGDEIDMRRLTLLKELEKEKCDDDNIKNICNNSRNINKKEYPDFLPQRKINKRYAYRLYGPGTQYSLIETLNYLNQHYYQEYTAIFLLKNRTELRIQGMDNLTDRKFEEYLTLFFSEIPFNCSVYINNDAKIEKNNPFPLTKGESLSIKVKKNGLEDISHTYQSYELKDQEAIRLPELRWEKRISKKFFRIIDSKGGELYNYRIFIDNDELSDQRDLFVSEERCKQRNPIDIKLDGYEIDSNTNWVQLSNISSETPHKVKVKRKKEKYNLDFPIFINGEKSYTSIIIEERGELRHSPIKGYNIDKIDKCNYELSYSPFYPLKNISGIVVFAFSILLLLFGGYLLGNAFPLRGEKTPTQQGLVHEEKKNKEIERKVNYLKEKETWNREEMVSLGLTELWDDLNNRQFDRILGKWNNKLRSHNISQWSTLTEKIESLKNENPNKYKESQGKPYNLNCNDYDVTISKYMNNLISNTEKTKTNQKQREAKRENTSETGIKPLDE
jgi:hypothetical protein